ncbi:hypothetical protein OsI_02403 [Oryza sativa Indica Group]|jgi:hypothetical protein|uniref:Uncharacterized protein n=1 Tax=Oryza sativa subsp. indica TaxID=39946 RepID=B8AA32_ORYSI|nr:hypothetical protein OsI_02403 [Oryza sativa Indica Group]
MKAHMKAATGVAADEVNRRVSGGGRREAGDRVFFLIDRMTQHDGVLIMEHYMHRPLSSILTLPIYGNMTGNHDREKEREPVIEET